MKIEAKARLLATGTLLSKLPQPHTHSAVTEDQEGHCTIKFDDNADAIRYVGEILHKAKEGNGHSVNQGAGQGKVEDWDALGGKTLHIRLSGDGTLRLLTASTAIKAQGYHSEMGEKMPEGKLFWSEYNFRSTYNLVWRAADNEKALSVLKQLRIRPVGNKTIQHGTPANYSPAAKLGTDVYHCLITFGAHDKLSDSGMMATHMLLD